MKLIFLGTTGYHPNDRRQTACIMIPEIGLVLDAGTGMYRVRNHLTTNWLDVFLSHAHLDHVMGVTFLFDILHERQMQYVRVYAEQSTIHAVEQHLFAEPLFPVRPPCEFRSLNGPMKLADGARLSYFPLKHPGGSTGFRLDWVDRSIAYVTDTTADPSASYVEAIRGVDVLIHECYFADGNEDLAAKTGHSCTTPVAQVAAAAGVKRLLLVHVNPLDEQQDPIGLQVARAIFPATEIAYDGLQIDI